MNSYKVLPVTYDDVVPWLLKIHYAHRVPSISYAFGLFDSDNFMIGVCTFGLPASPFLCIGVCGEENKDSVIELNRLVLSEGLPKNTASYFISKCIKNLPKKMIIVSYADAGMNHIGYVYQATNWLYTGATKERTDMSAGEGKHSRHNKGDSTNRVFRSSKHRYVYFHKCPKEVRDQLRYKTEPYPKGDNRRYRIDPDEIVSIGSLF